jgi:hypothetical protein
MSDRDALIRSLWEEGNNDVQSAAVIGCAPCTVYTIRKRLGLPCKTIQRVDKTRVLELWQQGMNDREIAAVIGVAAPSIFSARHALGLPCHRNCNGKDWHVMTFSDKIGTKMERSLTPPQCEVVREFLSDLLRCADQRRPGERYNISAFIKAWGHTA